MLSSVRARRPVTPEGNPNVGYLFADPMAEAKAWYRKTGLFPIMHTLGIRKTLVERHPWLPFSVFKAFEQSKQVALTHLTDTSATKVTLPFIEDQLHAARELMGHDFWSYGFENNRETLARFLHQHHKEGPVPSPGLARGTVSSSEYGKLQDLTPRQVRWRYVIFRGQPVGFTAAVNGGLVMLQAAVPSFSRALKMTETAIGRQPGNAGRLRLGQRLVSAQQVQEQPFIQLSYGTEIGALQWL